MLTYCFESAYVARTLARCRKNDLAVVDVEGHEKAVREAVNRDVWVYGYLNVGSVEFGRSYYDKFKGIRLGRYDGWDGEYWVDVTDKALRPPEQSEYTLTTQIFITCAPRDLMKRARTFSVAFQRHSRYIRPYPLLSLRYRELD